MSVKLCPSCHGTGHTLDPRAIGRRMKAKRLERRIGLRQMASHLRISPAYLSQMEHGVRHWSIPLLDRYSRKVGE